MNATDVRIRSAIIGRAADWFAAHRAGELKQDERAAFLSWLKTSPLHVEEYLAIAALERDVAAAAHGDDRSREELLTLARGAPQDNVSALHPDHDPTIVGTDWLWRPRQGVWSVAALVVLGLAFAAVLWRELWPGLPLTYQTARGVVAVWRLVDGSSLYLDADSKVTVRFSATERYLELSRGQALFEVAHDERRPFRVAAGAVSAVAVGTEFDVFRHPASTLIAVVNGQVAVSSTGRTSNAVRVGAGEQVRIEGDVVPATASRADVQQTVAWLQQRIVFDRRPLGEVADDFNRYNEAQVIIDDASLRALWVSGAFDAHDLDSFAAFLSSLPDVRVQRLAPDIVVTRAPHAPPSTVVPRAMHLPPMPVPTIRTQSASGS